MAVAAYTHPGPEAAPATASPTGTYWDASQARLTNALASQGPGNAFLAHQGTNLLATGVPSSYQHQNYGTEAITIATAQTSGKSIGSCTGSIPVIFNGATYWLEVGAASTVPSCVAEILDNAGIAYS
uniref:Uncharacterized protein n=1 Tax=viral metagenome TaxID=1070528 RepID=A0A6H1ZJJ9_9ZZZZ